MTADSAELEGARRLVRVVLENGVALLTLNRPDRRNALDEPLLSDLQRSLHGAIRDGARVIVVTGAGSAFCSGADISFLKGIDDADERRAAFLSRAPHLARLIDEVVAILRRSDIVSVAAVNGDAVGGGWLLALACDFCISTEAARFWFPEIQFGRAVGDRAVEQLVALGGQVLAKRALMAGASFSAAELGQRDLLYEVTAREALLTNALSLAKRVASYERAALESLKLRIACAVG